MYKHCSTNAHIDIMQIFAMYFILSGVSGCLPPRLIEEVAHNRTVNIQGGPGHNVTMDRMNEFLNNEFKGE